jgi:hypothetical protein
LTAPILTCVPNGTTVRLVGGPVYRDGHLWWMLEQGGWMVHESLVGAS